MSCEEFGVRVLVEYFFFWGGMSWGLKVGEIILSLFLEVVVLCWHLCNTKIIGALLRARVSSGG